MPLVQSRSHAVSAACSGARRLWDDRPVHYRLLVAAVLAGSALVGCGDVEDSVAGAAPPAVAKQWGDALRRGDIEAACKITVPTRTPCSERLREQQDPTLGPVSDGSIGIVPTEGDAVFSFGGKRGTIFITVIGKEIEQRVRFEAVVSG